jgi:hypothetical protein
LELYGVTLKHQDRVRGGINSQLARRMNPEKYKALGCPIPREYNIPSLKSEELAEFMGIMLGDGGITSTQFSITLNSIADASYIEYVRNLLRLLFGVDAYIGKRKEANAVVFTLSGVRLITFLKTCGLKVGDKVRNQVDVPQWVKDSTVFSRLCLRGLMDTDGGVFRHTYKVNGKNYCYLKTCFTNMSQPLRRFV